MSDSQPRPVELRPSEFMVAEDDPFGSDRLNRKESVESLCSVIETAEGPLVVSVEGAYGTGKSAFLRMCATHLERQDGTATVEFNAWQQGHTRRPLIDLVAALAVKLGDKNSWEDVKDAAKQVAWRVAGSLTKGIVAPSDSGDASVFDEWLDIDNGVVEFRSALAEQIRSCGKLVIFVDELDRCEPTYALDLLNRARHLFDVPGVVIVFGVNRAELGHAVETQYGPGCDVDGYLRRFVDLSVQLRQPTNEEWASYVSHVCVSLSGCSPELQNASLVIRDLLVLLANNCGGRLRDVEQVVRHANLALPPRNYNQVWPVWLICLLTLRYVDRDSYERFVKGIVDVWDLFPTMREHLPLDGDGTQLATLDAIVLLMPGDSSIPYDEDEFVKKYTAIRKGKDDDARAAHGWFMRFGGRSRESGRRSLESLHKTIEIAAPN